MLFGGLAIAGAIYLLVTIGASMVVPTGDLASSDGPLLEVVKQGPLGIPEKLFSAIALLALANGALINMIMASRLLYGMSEERRGAAAASAPCTPARRTPWVAIVFTTALGADPGHHRRPREARRHDGALLLVVFAIVNVTVLVLRRDEVEHDHFRVPAICR